MIYLLFSKYYLYIKLIIFFNIFKNFDKYLFFKINIELN